MQNNELCKRSNFTPWSERLTTAPPSTTGTIREASDDLSNSLMVPAAAEELS